MGGVGVVAGAGDGIPMRRCSLELLTVLGLLFEQ
jgi:hypothetical protein